MGNGWSLNMQPHEIDFEWVPTDNNPSDCLSRMIDEGLNKPHDFDEAESIQSNKLVSILVAESKMAGACCGVFY